MRILFVACYVDNCHFIDYQKQCFDKNLKNCSYDVICLNDSIEPGHDNYLGICDILTGANAYNMIKDKAEKNNFIHIKIPQDIHDDMSRPNHGGPRHIENLNWFNQNINNLIPNYKDYDFLCHIDSDALLCKPIDLDIELAGYDMAGPLIYLPNNYYYIHTGLFFINLKTILNMNEISWNNTKGTDTGSDIANFIRNNPQYKIKKLGHYDGYGDNNWIENNHTIIKLNLLDTKYGNYNLIDSWFDGKFIHFRGGSCFGVGSNRHRVEEGVKKYFAKFEQFIKLLE